MNHFDTVFVDYEQVFKGTDVAVINWLKTNPSVASSPKACVRIGVSMRIVTVVEYLAMHPEW